ncbi:LysR substrate-binding domain-containing protein [Streptomyces eurythermus]
MRRGHGWVAQTRDPSTVRRPGQPSEVVVRLRWRTIRPRCRRTSPPSTRRPRSSACSVPGSTTRFCTGRPATTRCRSPTVCRPAPSYRRNRPAYACRPPAPLAGQEQIELADLAGETWTTLTDDGDGGPEAMTDACRRAGFMPTLRYRIADRKMRWERIAAGRAISLCRPTSPHAEGTVPRPPAGDPITDASGSRGTGPRSPNGAPACCTGLRHGRTSTASPTTPSTARGGTPVRNCTRSSTERTRGLRRGRAFTVWSGGARRFRPSGEVAGTRSSGDSP